MIELLISNDIVDIGDLSNDCATIESYTVLKNSCGNIPSCSWPSHSSQLQTVTLQ